MPFVDLSQGVPVGARWIKVRYTLRPKKAGEPLLAKIWSGNPARAVLLKDATGEALLKLEVPQTLSYECGDAIDLSLKVVAYNLSE